MVGIESVNHGMMPKICPLPFLSSSQTLPTLLNISMSVNI